MRLLILTPEYLGSGGGITTFYRSLIPALQTQGVNVRVIEGSAYHAAEDKSLRLLDGVSVETLELGRLRKWHSQLGQFAATPGLRRHLAAAWGMWEQAQFGEDADIIEACDWGLLFVPAALDARLPFVVQCHGSIGQIATHDSIRGEQTQAILTRLLECAVLARVDAIQTYSCENAAYWRGETGRHTHMLRPAWAPSAVGSIQGHSDRGLVIGRVQRWKGPQVLCAALELLGDSAPKIDWVGRDTAWEHAHTSAVSHLSRTYPKIWGEKIAHHAPIAPTEVGHRQAGARFNVVPSTWDVFNFTAAEAMASGRPTIVSNGAGAHEIIKDRVNGYVFPAGDAEGLASAIDRVLSAKASQLADVGRAAQETVRSVLAPPTIAAQRVAAYRSTIEAFGKRRGSRVPKTLHEMCRPTDPADGDDVSFLDQLPLKSLIRYVAGRVGKKALSKANG